ncbi:patatin-like protein 2 [Macadamia integrifolia]|uniref:patatin-like protein 2 n=1 Tax=Macadamia integrifolia TaxID=60698 RepID=UPI001C5009B0|nr:patatin-like protein 2 [Macadamia integrifolia]
MDKEDTVNEWPDLEQDGELRALLAGQKYSWLLQLIKIIKETPTLLEVIKETPALMPQLLSPKYDGKNLHQIIRDNLGKWKLGETLTNVLITSFDVKIMQPTIFSTFRARANEIDDSLMSDVCISTSAAPTYFPPYYFKNTTLSVTKEFNVTDGGLAANNPTLLAMGEMMKESKREAGCNKCSNQALDYSRYLVLSLGTGEAKNEGKMVVEGKNWGIIDWLFGPDIAPPLIESLVYASSDMVDIYTAMCFHDRTCKDNYLRIQCENLTSSEASIDNASKENLEKLGKIGEELLEKPVSLVDLVTGNYIPVTSGMTNKEALTKFAKRLSDERRRRLQKMQSCSGPCFFH